MQFKSCLLVAALIVGVFTSAAAQREKTIFHSFRLSGAWGGSKHQVAQFGDSRSYMRGGHFGLEFGKSLFIGLSSMSLKTDPNWDALDDQEFGLNWRGGTLGYTFGAHRAIHPVVNVDFGPGKVRKDNQVDGIFAVQPTAGIEINVFRWFHLGLEGGYRFISDSNVEGLTDSDLSGPFGQATLRFGWSWGRSPKKVRSQQTSNRYND